MKRINPTCVVVYGNIRKLILILLGVCKKKHNWNEIVFGNILK